MTKPKTLTALIGLHTHNDLAKQEGMVHQVWEDGERTLTKSGSLLGQRSLHCIDPGVPNKAIDIHMFPHQTNGHGFMYTTSEGAYALRDAILFGEH